jgi:hypothetical protein
MKFAPFDLDSGCLVQVEVDAKQRKEGESFLS